MTTRSLFTFLGVVGALLATTAVASAHVIVTPNQVGIAATQMFSMAVPGEKDGLTADSVRLVLPSGLQQVSPTVVAGWKVDTKKDSNGNVTEIDWSGVGIPNEQHADLTFSAQVPASPGKLDWKAYQTYSDGSVVSWDQTPIPGKETLDGLYPYSRTMVINDLASIPVAKTTPLWLGVITLIISLFGVGLTWIKLRK